MTLSNLLPKDAIIADLQSTTKEGVIEEISTVISRVYPDQDKGNITLALLEREKLGSTGIEHGIAIPHAKIKGLDRIILGFGRSREGIEFQAHDGKLSYIFFVLLAPDSAAGIHLKTLARLSRLLKEEEVRLKIMKAATADDIYNIIMTEDEGLKC